MVKVEVSTALWPPQAKAGDAAALRQLLETRLAAVKAIHQTSPEKVPKKSPRYVLTFTPALLGTPASGGSVVATLVLRREVEGISDRYRVDAEARFLGGDGSSKIQAALDVATSRAVGTARLQMAALEASDAKLHQDLQAKDARVRSFALARLAEAHDPAAIPGLRAELQSDDPDVVRRAMGGLVALGDEGAVPALIDATHRRPPEFQREVIYALGEIGGADARGYLYTVSQGADLEPIRVAAQEALNELEARTHPQEKP